MKLIFGYEKKHQLHSGHLLISQTSVRAGNNRI
jgi:hypothetical protein